MPVARERGVRFEFLRMRPHDHMGWVFEGTSEIAAPALTATKMSKTDRSKLNGA